MSANEKFRGSFTALVTPFSDGKLDEKGFREFVAWQIAEGTDGLVPVGTTGESPTLSHDEHHKVVEWCVAEAKGRVPVIAGAGSNSTTEAVALARHAENAGADAVLVVTPYYNKPTQEGMYQHVAPALCKQLQEATLAGDYKQGLAIQDRLVPLHHAIFLEPGLAGAKYGLSLLQRGREDVRLPLLPVTAPTKTAIRNAMVHAGLIN